MSYINRIIKGFNLTVPAYCTCEIGKLLLNVVGIIFILGARQLSFDILPFFTTFKQHFNNAVQKRDNVFSAVYKFTLSQRFSTTFSQRKSDVVKTLSQRYCVSWVVIPVFYRVSQKNTMEIQQAVVHHKLS